MKEKAKGAFMDPTPVLFAMSPATPEGTTIWASEKVIEFIHGNNEGLDPAQWERLKGKLQSFCDANFKIFMPETVKREFGKTFGVHISHFRIVGFFHEGYDTFIAMDWFIKKKQKNDKRMNAIYKKVDEIREAETWMKIE